MKKTFVNPEMNISLFDMENVVTDSTNVAEATAALTDKGISTTNITNVEWTF